MLHQCVQQCGSFLLFVAVIAMLQTVNGLPCEWHLKDSRATKPTDKELRSYMAQAKRVCPEGSRLAGLMVRLTEGGASVTVRYSGLSRFDTDRKAESPAKPERYTLYDAVEIAKARTRHSFHNTWHSCEVCRQFPYANPTKEIDGKWICYNCWTAEQGGT